MAQASRNERKKRRVRRNLCLVTRELRNVNARHINAQFVLLAMLQSLGGSVVVNPEDVDTAMKAFTHLHWQSDRQEDGSMKVTLLDDRQAAPEDLSDTEARPNRSVTAQLMGRPVDADPVTETPAAEPVTQ